MKFPSACLAICVGAGLVQGCSNAPVTAVEAAPAAQPFSPVRLGTASAANLGAELVRKCTTTRSFECDVLRRVVVGEVVRALERSEAGRDLRARDQALRLLDITEEPEILIAAIRVLGHFADTPTLGSKLTPLMLESPYVQVQSLAAKGLATNPDSGFQDLGRLWTDGHATIQSHRTYDEYPDFPTHYASMGFPEYPGAEWFSPADSDRSIGWSTTDDLDKVAKWFGDTLHAEAMTPQAWNDVGIAQSQLPIKALIDPARMARMQQLIDRLMKGDQTAQPELDKLQKESDDLGQKAGEAGEKSVLSASSAPPSFAAAGRWIVAKKKGERISQLVMVFPVPALKRTAIKYIWDLSDYPSAWPATKGRTQ